MENFSNGQNRDLKSMTMAEIDEAITRIGQRIAAATPSGAPKAPTVSAALKAKMILTSVLMFITVFALVFSSYAYFIATTESSQNIIKSTYVNVELSDPFSSETGNAAGTELDPIKFFPGHVETREVFASNNGDTALYVRAKTESVITLAEKYVSYAEDIDLSLVSFNIDEEKWIKRGDHYYYAVPLLGGEQTAKLFSEVTFSTEMDNIYQESTVRIRIVFEFVQAANNGDTVFDAAGWTTDSAEGGESR